MKFLVVEGPDGSGKTTMVDMIEKEIALQGNFMRIREPGGTIIGERIREVLMTEPMSESLRMKLFALARDILFDSIPDDMELIISDRSFVSSLVYQGLVGGIKSKEILDVNASTLAKIKEFDLILLSLDTKTMMGRIASRKEENTIFDNEGYTYQKNIRSAYEKIPYYLSGLKNSGNKHFVDMKINVHIVDANGTIEEVKEKVLSITKKITKR